MTKAKKLVVPPIKQLSKAKLAARAALVETLRETAATVAATHAAYVAAVTAHNEALEEAREWRDLLVAGIERAIAEEAEAGQPRTGHTPYEEWRNSLEDLNLEEMYVPDEPEPMDCADQLDELPDVPCAG